MPITRRELLTAAVGGGALAATGAFAQPPAAQPPGHVVLLGDSMFDNQMFVGQGKPVVDNLREALPAGWKATLLAAVSQTAREVAVQLRQLPKGATHLVLCAGGNNAILGLFNLFQQAAPQALLARLQQDRADFERDYAALVKQMLAKKLHAVLCTIPDPDFTHPNLRNLQLIGQLGLPLFNDVISRTAAKEQLPLLDLRVLVQGKPDHAPGDGIHLSPAGGRKVAEQIVKIVEQHDFTKKQSIIYS
ncbi:MAG: SGNH/GDSL hydrolase family protein [Planctomycetales bacterium]